jgi:UDP-glucose 4-epimerase
LNYLITGGAGFIGSHVSEALIARGETVTILDDFSTGDIKNIEGLLRNKNLRVVNGSVLDKKILEIEIKKSDHVLHFAAAVGVLNIVNNPLKSLLINLDGTSNVINACSNFGKEFFLASTSEIYGKNSTGFLNENSDRIVGSPFVNRWSYSEAKALDESLAYFQHISNNLIVRIIRFFNTVGPKQTGSYGMVIPRFIQSALRGIPIEVYGDGSQSRCFCHVSDATRAVLNVIDSKITVGEVYNVGGDVEISILELAKRIKYLTKSNSEILKVPYSSAYNSGFEDIQKRIPDTTKIRQALNWFPKFEINNIILDIIESLR